ncbi:hypothetical protein ACFVGM_08875 [Kitasatospora purpeofusca]|uniref:T4 family baseplate hub assembly chaperone n=1 Tax=Kitasatospora purpeofusca TaxID=67352 RepID=UPI003689EDF2
MTSAPDLRELAGRTIDARTDPEQAAAASARFLAQAHLDERPEIEDVPDTSVQLHRGILRGGTWYRTAEVRELTGADEEALAAAGSSWPRILDTLLLRGVCAVGPEPVTRALADELILGDRDQLVLAVRRVSFGDAISYERVRCPHCDELSDVTVPLDEIPVVRLDDPDVEEFPVPLRHGRTAYLRLPNGADQRAVLALKDASTAAQNTLMIGRCLLRLEGPDGKMSGSAQLARDLPMADRHTIVAHLAQIQPGPRYLELTFTHEVCGGEVPLPIGIGDLFR